MSSNAGDLTKAKIKADVSPIRHRIRYGLFGLAVVIGILAVVIWPFDETLSDTLCISRVGHVATPLWWEALKGVRVFGKAEVLLVIGFLLAIHGRKQAAVCACIAVLLASIIVTPTKLIVGRPRPDGSNSISFPSGDAASVAAFVVPIASTIPALRPVAFAGVVAVGAVRVANGFHFPSDVLAGMAIGIFAGAVMLSIGFSLKSRARRLLRRSWVAAALGVLVLIHLFLPSVGNFRTFFSIFGPSVALLAVSPFIRTRLRSRRQSGRRLLSGMICFFGGASLAATVWFVLKLMPALRVRLPALVPADPSPVWTIFGMGCVLAAVVLLSVRECDAKRYRSTVGFLAAGMAGLFFIIFSFVASHGWTVLSLKAAG